jgi:hypothetical protein
LLVEPLPRQPQGDTGGPGVVTIELSLADAGAPITLRLVGARAEASVAADGLTSGRLGGALTTEAVNDELIPAVTDILTGIVESDASCNATDPAFGSGTGAAPGSAACYHAPCATA